MNVQPLMPDRAPGTRRVLAARLEPFDSYWQAPKDIEAGYSSFAAYYRANYLQHLPADRNARILVISCGPGYLVEVLAKAGYRCVVGIDSDPSKIEHARRHSLPCEVAEAFNYLERSRGEFDVIIPEQELNHLTHQETIEFLQLCNAALRPGGRIVVYAMNGANPLVGSENLPRDRVQPDAAAGARRLPAGAAVRAEAVRVLEESPELRRARSHDGAGADDARDLHALRQEGAGAQQEGGGRRREMTLSRRP